MTVQTQTPVTNVASWEARFFADITLESAERAAKVATAAHEKASVTYISAAKGSDRENVIISRVMFSRSLIRLHSTQRMLNKAKAEVARTHTISSHL